jgi:lipoprotein-anchoring transpeptidase ErfK/SrfK
MKRWLATFFFIFLGSTQLYAVETTTPLSSSEYQSALLKLEKLMDEGTLDSTQYVVKAGDSLYAIAKRYGTTVELLQKSNHITGDLIRPGMKLKVSQTEFHVRVDKSENRLMLYAGDDLIKTYVVATGIGERTPIGTFTIENKLVDPVWYHAGAILPPDSPDNILGTRWLGFSASGYGIHGTTIPESIGTNATEGCVRMHNHDVEELYSILPLKTKVTVVE